MSSTPPEEAEQEQSFLSHLIELRTRIVRAAVSVLIALLALSPFMKQIYDFLVAGGLLDPKTDWQKAIDVRFVKDLKIGVK